jgi:hypothetical protein
MQVQYVSKYIALSEEGLVPRLECPMDQGPLLPNQDMQDRVFVYCLSCDYKKILGTKDYEEILGLIKNAE